VRARRLRRELAAEIEAHIAERTEELMENGVPENEARQQARREFGNPTRIAEAGGEVWGWTWLERIAKDLRYGARALRASPLFTLAVVLSLALGMGANTAIFTLLYASLWRPLPVPAPQQVYQLWRHADSGPWIGDFGDSYVLFRRLGQAGRGAGDVFAASGFAARKFGVGGAANERITGAAVSANFFTVLGVNPMRGRLFEPQDDNVLGGSRVAVLSHAFWTRRFQADSSILGKTILYDETPYTVVGVAQPGFTGIEAEASVDVWVPVTSSVDKGWLTSPDVNWLRVLVRLHPGVSPAGAQALFENIFRRHVADRLLPGAAPYWKTVLEAEHITLRAAGAGLATTGHKYQKPLLLVMALVAIVLLIACANVTNLILARNHARQHEIEIRRALGASRWRIAGQLFSESLLLAAAGAAGGLAMAAWGTRLLISFLPRQEVPLAFDLRPGLAVLGFTAAIALATAVLVGLLPAWRAGADRTWRAARRIAQTSFSGRLLAAGQLALALLLLIGAGLFAATLRNLKNADLGFRPDHVITFSLAFPKATEEPHMRQVYDGLKARLALHPGVMVTGYAWPGIYGRGGWSGGIRIEGRSPQPGEDNEVGMIAASAGFFQAIGLPLVRGRYLDARDQDDKPPVVVVNESLARYFFGGGPVLGRHIMLARFPKTPREIVGVVRDARHYGVRDPVMRMVYLPAWRVEAGSFYVRMQSGAILSNDSIRAEAAALDKSAQLEDVAPLETSVDDVISQERLTATLSAAFGILALLLAAVGLYGVVAYSVSRRTNEFGIRMALGAQRADVQKLVLRQTIVPVGAGLAAGLAAAASLTRFLSTIIAGMLYGVSPEDTVVFAGAALLLAAIALLAGLLPARRAARIDPMSALRYE